jgi:YtxH-like protein
MSYFSTMRQNDLLRPFGLRRITPAQQMMMNTVVPTFAVLGLGVAIGASVALLFAPKTGREFRNDLNRRANQLTDTVRNGALKRNENEWSTTPNISNS